MENPGVRQWQTEVPGRNGSTGMTAYRIAGITLGVLVIGIVLSQVPDIIRYIRISSM